MQLKSKQFTNRKAGVFENLELDQTLYLKIVQDMCENGGQLIPTNYWIMVDQTYAEKSSEDADLTAIPDSSSAQTYSEAAINVPMEKILDNWIGCMGMQSISEEDLKKNEKFLRNTDWIGIFDYICQQGLKEYDYKSIDLATIAETNIILASLLRNNPDGEKRILEVGGGYGRIAEALNNIASGIKYVLIDAVPASILYSYEYLRKMLPEKKVGFYYCGDSFDLEKWDVYIVPAWHFEECNGSGLYDLCINIHSMQEMSQSHVDYYMDLFNKVLQNNGIVFLENSHEFVFKGIWRYNECWERIYMYNSPASWTEYHPIEIFEKHSNVTHPQWNQCVKAGYLYGLYEKEMIRAKAEEAEEKLQKTIERRAKRIIKKFLKR